MSVYHRRIGTASQHYRMGGVLGMATCPVELRARLDFASRRRPTDGDSAAMREFGRSASEAGVMDAARREATAAIMTSPERVFVFARNGIVMLRMVPVVMVRTHRAVCVLPASTRQPPARLPVLPVCSKWQR